MEKEPKLRVPNPAEFVSSKTKAQEPDIFKRLVARVRPEIEKLLVEEVTKKELLTLDIDAVAETVANHIALKREKELGRAMSDEEVDTATLDPSSKDLLLNATVIRDEIRRGH